MPITVNVLGPLTLGPADSEVAVGSTQVRTLCAILALSPGQVVSVDALQAELYGENDIRNSRNALQATVARLRRVCTGVGLVVRTHPRGYHLDVDPGDVDATCFTQLLQQATVGVGHDPRRARDVVTRALHLWRGPALFDVAAGPRLRADQVALDEQRLSALECLSEARLRLGEHGALVADLKRLAEIHPERERFSQLLMLALYREGQQVEALTVFQAVSLRLRSDLGLEPSARLCRVQQAILRHDVQLESVPGLLATLG